jgi:hypothetical protein
MGFMNERVNLIIKNLGLKKHIEGGYFSETYRSEEILDKNCLPEKFDGERNLTTSIYFLLTGDDFSAFHKLKADEVWHFYEGSALNIYVIDENGNLKINKLGSSIDKGESFQIVVKLGQWFAAGISKNDSYCLAGCTVSPGFDFKDFELGNREHMVKLYPKNKILIEKLTR